MGMCARAPVSRLLSRNYMHAFSSVCMGGAPGGEETRACIVHYSTEAKLRADICERVTRTTRVYDILVYGDGLCGFNGRPADWR